MLRELEEYHNLRPPEHLLGNGALTPVSQTYTRFNESFSSAQAQSAVLLYRHARHMQRYERVCGEACVSGLVDKK